MASLATEVTLARIVCSLFLVALLPVGWSAAALFTHSVRSICHHSHCSELVAEFETNVYGVLAFGVDVCAVEVLVHADGSVLV